LDEPLSNLDAKLRVQTRSELIKLHQRLGTTFIYVTHDQTEAMTMADRIAVLKDGLLQQLDTPQNLYDHPGNIFVAGFIGSPSMNMFDGTITGSGDDLYVDAASFRLKLTPAIKARLKDGAGKKVVFGIRPEDIYFPGFVAGGVTTVDVESTVDVTELMGNEIFLYLMTGAQAYIARVDPRAHARAGEKVHMAFNADNIHLFDVEAEGQPTLLKTV
jgi:multiple sugar transport system ATP-binding protein